MLHFRSTKNFNISFFFSVLVVIRKSHDWQNCLKKSLSSLALLEASQELEFQHSFNRLFISTLSIVFLYHAPIFFPFFLFGTDWCCSLIWGPLVPWKQQVRNMTRIFVDIQHNNSSFGIYRRFGCWFEWGTRYFASCGEFILFQRLYFKVFLILNYSPFMMLISTRYSLLKWVIIATFVAYILKNWILLRKKPFKLNDWKQLFGRLHLLFDLLAKNIQIRNTIQL